MATFYLGKDRPGVFDPWPADADPLASAAKLTLSLEAQGATVVVVDELHPWERRWNYMECRAQRDWVVANVDKEYVKKVALPVDVGRG